MLKVWIAGSAGQIGTAINQVLDPMEMEVFNTDKNELDITQTDEVLRFGEINRPNIIINCAAITDTALCEQEPELDVYKRQYLSSCSCKAAIHHPLCFYSESLRALAHIFFDLLPAHHLIQKLAR